MNDLESLIFYVVTFIISAMIIARVGKMYKHQEEIKNFRFKIIILTIIGLGIPILISSLRYYVGTDYDNYLNLYNTTKNYSFLQIFKEGEEILFLIIIKIASLFDNYQVVFAIMAFLTVFIMYATLLNYKEKLSLGFLFFLYLFMSFASSFNLVKQALAVVIVAYSYKFIFERNFKKFVLAIIIASLFHVSALLFLPFYFISSVKNDRKGKFIRVCYVIFTIIIVLNYQRIVGMISSVSIFEKYSVYATEVESANREAILNIIILAIILLFRKPLIKYDSKNEIFIFFAIINGLLLLTGFVTPFAKRIAEYFGISNMILLATFPNLAKTKEQKITVYFLIAVYAISMFVISTYVLKQAHILPYQTIIGK